MLRYTEDRPDMRSVRCWGCRRILTARLLSPDGLCPVCEPRHPSRCAHCRDPLPMFGYRQAVLTTRRYCSDDCFVAGEEAIDRIAEARRG
jgi:predicted RNA-binding Zn-ribbon protein involved in translation (DUF1610 family)